MHLHKDVVRLRNEDVLLGELRRQLREKLRHRVRSVHHREAHVARVLARLPARAAATQLPDSDRRHLIVEGVGHLRIRR